LDGLEALSDLIMLPLLLGTPKRRLRVLCLGAHSDDIEIGCGGTLLRLLDDRYRLDVTWVVASADAERVTEATASARALLRSADRVVPVFGELPDAHFPADFARAKEFFRALRARSEPDLVFTHRLEDRHQDHRLMAELTWQTWRDHLTLEYEIPKYEGDLGQPNLFVPLTRAQAQRKTRHLMKHFSSQRSKDWFSEDAFAGLMRLRGIECRSPSGLAEAYQLRKAVI
jgi:LmbE family N-acetylglucosaminyl deacetylase